MSGREAIFCGVAAAAAFGGLTGLVSWGDRKTTPLSREQILETAWQSQARRLTDLFAGPLRFSREEYFVRLPRFNSGAFAELGVEYQDRFPIPLLVQPPEGALTLQHIINIIGGQIDLDGRRFDPSKVDDWATPKNNRPYKRFITPSMPYATWLNDGSVSRDRSVHAVRIALADDERGGTIHDVLRLALRDLEILLDHYLDAPGSEMSEPYSTETYHPTLRSYAWIPRLVVRHSFEGWPKWGSVVAGRNVVVKVDGQERIWTGRQLV